jgi:hypothetical protein
MKSLLGQVAGNAPTRELFAKIQDFRTGCRCRRNIHLARAEIWCEYPLATLCGRSARHIEIEILTLPALPRMQ